MKKRYVLAAAFAVLALSLTACSPAGNSSGGGSKVIKIGFITKFPVDFYDTMVQAAKDWDAKTPGAELVFSQG